MSKRVCTFKNWISSSVNSCLTQQEPITQRCDSSFSTIYFLSVSYWVSQIRDSWSGESDNSSQSLPAQYFTNSTADFSGSALLVLEELKDFVSTICSTADFCDAAVELRSSVILAGCADKTPVDLHCFAVFFSPNTCDGIVLFQTAGENNAGVTGSPFST